MITIKTREEVRLLRECGRRLAAILAEVVRAVKPGISTLDLDRLAESLILESGGAPAFKGYKIAGAKMSYPASLCASVNDEVVHAIPRKDRILKDGDIISLDIAMWWPKEIKNLTFESRASGRGKFKIKNYPLVTDMAITVGVGKISEQAEKLIKVTKEALDIGVGVVRSGIHIGDIGYAIERHLNKYNLGIVRNLAGHGVGHKLHEDPLIPNYGDPGTGVKLKEGMVFAIEPMTTLGGGGVKIQEDGWAFKTVDGSLSAHFEHTMAVTKEGSEVLTGVV